MDKIAQRFMVPVPEEENVTDSNDDNQPEFGGVATVIKPQKYVSPQSIHAQLRIAGMKRHCLDRIRRINENEAPVSRRKSFNKVETRVSIDGSCTNERIGTPEIQETKENGDETDEHYDSHY